MNNLVLMPILIPLTIGMILVLFRKNIRTSTLLSVLAVLAIGMISIFLLNQIKTEGIQTLQLGGWEAPFGVSMVADMFSALLVLTSSLVALCCLIYAFRSIGKDRESIIFTHYFYF